MNPQAQDAGGEGHWGSARLLRAAAAFPAGGSSMPRWGRPPQACGWGQTTPSPWERGERVMSLGLHANPLHFWGQGLAGCRPGHRQGPARQPEKQLPVTSD